MGLWILGIGLCVASVILSVGAVLNARAQRRAIEQAAEKAVKRVSESLIRALDE